MQNASLRAVSYHHLDVYPLSTPFATVSWPSSFRRSFCRRTALAFLRGAVLLCRCLRLLRTGAFRLLWRLRRRCLLLRLRLALLLALEVLADDRRRTATDALVLRDVM